MFLIVKEYDVTEQLYTSKTGEIIPV